MPRRRISEAETRKEVIDPQFEKAGWYPRNKTKVGIQFPVDGHKALHRSGKSVFLKNMQFEEENTI